MRRSTGFLLFTGLELALLGLAGAHAAFRWHSSRPALARKAEVVRRLQLTDLAVFTEARYTRHPSQADLNSPFQEHPHSLEHFPSGSLVRPPAAHWPGR